MITQNIILGEGSRYPLKGILTLPDNGQKVPAVVLVHGSGSSNMDEKVGKLTPFKDLAQGLAAHGIASIRYDKRSYAHPLKMMKDGCITVKEETIEDAILATGLLREDPRIDPEKIFIIGHSMGAMLAPRIDAEGGCYRGLILMAGTPRKLEEVMLGQTEEMLAAVSFPVRWILKKQTAKLKEAFASMYQLTDAQAKAKKMGNGTTLYYFKEMGEHPAADYLQKLQKPILILQGGKDFQAKADVDFAIYRQLMQEKPNATFMLYENLNHAFVPAVYDTIDKAKQEYNIPRSMDETVIRHIANWILSV